MGLETGTYLVDLVGTNPTSGDAKSQGDDHLRLVKLAGAATCPVDAPVYPLTSGTATNLAGNTSVDFTSIPSWVKKITIVSSAMSTNGTSVPLIQIGDSGGVEVADYLGSNVVTQTGTSTNQGTNNSTGFVVVAGVASTTIVYWTATLTLLNSATNLWVFSVIGGSSNADTIFSGGGSKALSATLDRVRLTTTNGTDAFDGGSINILYE